jgi:hypothetical protein
LAKSAREIMEILEAFDLTRCAWSAAQLAGCDPKTVTAYVAMRDAGADPLAGPRRPRSIDPFLAKLEELVDRSQGKIRADVAHDRLVAMGFAGSYRTTRRAVAELKAAWQPGHGRRYRPWVPEPGMWTGVRLGRRPQDRATAHQPVLCLAGLVALPRRGSLLGSDARHAGVVPRPDAAPAGRRANLPAV